MNKTAMSTASKTGMRSLWVIALVLIIVPALASANSLQVTAAAAMGNSTGTACGGQPCGLEVVFDDPASVTPTPVYVGTGNAVSDGFNDETAIDIEFIVNPLTLTMPAGSFIRLGTLFQDFTPGTGVKIVLFIERNAGDTAWRFHIWYRQNGGPFAYGGGSFLTNNGLAALEGTKVNIEWDGTTGTIRSYRTQDRPGAAKLLMTEVTGVNIVGQTLDVFWLGLVSPQPAGVIGSLYLDEVVINRM